MTLLNRHERETTFVPLTDIFETENEYSLQLEIPGVPKENLNITLEDNELEITGKISNKKPETLSLKYTDFYADDYYRKFKIGSDVDRNRIDAELKNGILSLMLYKKEESKPKKIEIKAN